MDNNESKPKHAGGRPTKYDPQFIQEIYKYLEKQGNNSLPTMQGLALYLGVSKDSLNEWEKIYPEFSVALEDLMNTQAEQLINDSLYNGANSTIAKLILSSNHGMRERTDLTTNDKDLPAPLLGGLAKDSIENA